jgi:hypothetical protein
MTVIINQTPKTGEPCFPIFSHGVDKERPPCHALGCKGGIGAVGCFIHLSG